MEKGYCGLYIDNKDVFLCKINAEGEICNDKYLWDEDYFKLDNILEEYKDIFGKVILSFDEDINEYEKLHIVDMLLNKNIDIIMITHKFVSFMLSYIFTNWIERKEEICDIDTKKNYLIMDLGYSFFKVGIISIENSIEKLDFELIAYSTFDTVNTKLIYKMLIDYAYNINNYKSENLFIFNDAKGSDDNKKIEIKEEIRKNIEKSISQSFKKGYFTIDLEQYGIDNISIQNSQFENSILSLIKTNMKGLIEEFYLEHKDILKGKYIDHLIFLGDFNRFPYLANYIKSFFNKECKSTFIGKNSYGALGALLYGLVDRGESIIPFIKDGIVYAGKDIILYQNNEFISMIKKSTICPYEEVKLIFLGNVIENPIKFKIARIENDELYTIQDLNIYLPFSYFGDTVEIKINIDKNRNVDGIILHKRTGEEVLFNFSL